MANARTSDYVVWDAVAGAVDYEIELVRTSGEVEKTIVQTATSILVLDLISESPTPVAFGDSRKVRVRARETLGAGDWSLFLTFTLVGLPAPGNLRVE